MYGEVSGAAGRRGRSGRLNLSNPRSSLSPQVLQESRYVELRTWVLRVHLAQGLDQDHRHGPVPVDLVVRRDHVPGRPTGRAPSDREAIGAHVVLPAGALLDVLRVELPAFVGVFQPADEALPLFLVRDVQAELDHGRAALDELLLEFVDLAVAPLDHRRGREVVNASDQHVLVVGAVEDADEAGVRQPSADPPEKSPPTLLWGGRFEWRDEHA